MPVRFLSLALRNFESHPATAVGESVGIILKDPIKVAEWYYSKHSRKGMRIVKGAV